MARGARSLSLLTLAALAIAIAAGCGERQPERTPVAEREARATARSAITTVPAGTVMEIRTHTVLSAERNRAGDAFTAGLAGPIVDADGRVIIPADALVRGRVTAVGAPVEGGGQAVLHLAFEAISFAGYSLSLQADVEQVIGRTEITVLRDAGVGPGTGTAIGVDAGSAEPILPRGTGLLIRVAEPVVVGRQGAGA